MLVRYMETRRFGLSAWERWPISAVGAELALHTGWVSCPEVTVPLSSHSAMAVMADTRTSEPRRMDTHMADFPSFGCDGSLAIRLYVGGEA